MQFKRIEAYMKRVIIAALLVVTVSPAAAMVGGPAFCVGSGMTGMIVSASQVNTDLFSPQAAGERERMTSNRMMLTARYGLADNLDFSAVLGTADLGFTGLPAGYSTIDGQWNFAWGAGARIGYPVHAEIFQIVLGAEYFGFQPKTETSNGYKTVGSQYLWHEVAPSALLGFRLGKWVPYCGVTKPYLFGRRDLRVSLRGVNYPELSSTQDYSDVEQPLRGIAGLEWKLPQGYSITAEAAANLDNAWTLTIGLAQVMK